MSLPETQVTIGTRLNSLRTERGLTMRDLSAATGVPRTTIYEIETLSGKDIKLSVLCKLADYFGVSIEYLAVGEMQGEKKPEYNKLSRENTNFINGLENSAAEELNKFIKKYGEDFVLLLLEMRDARRDIDHYKSNPLSDCSSTEDFYTANEYYTNAQLQKADFLQFCFNIAELYLPRADINTIRNDIENAEMSALINGIGTFDEEDIK